MKKASKLGGRFSKITDSQGESPPGVFKSNTPQILALHNVELEDWRFGKSSWQYTPDEMHVFLLVQGLPENTYERLLAQRDVVDSYRKYSIPSAGGVGMFQI